MNKIRHISQDELFTKFDIDKLNLENKLFNKSDVSYYLKLDKKLSKANRISTIVSYFIFAIFHPKFLYSFIIPQIYRAFFEKTDKNKSDWRKSNFILTNNLKASIAASLNPKKILEIGTYLGAGAASFKYVSPEAKIYTINPKENKDVNNPIEDQYIGYFCKKKKLKVIQIYADSTNFNFSKIGKMDLTFIDGNHSYSYVYKDIGNTSKITKKAILIDDYVPERESGNGLVYGPWVEGVVKALDDYLRKNPKDFKEAYWIKKTKYALLIK